MGTQDSDVSSVASQQAQLRQFSIFESIIAEDIDMRSTLTSFYGRDQMLNVHLLFDLLHTPAQNTETYKKNDLLYVLPKRICNYRVMPIYDFFKILSVIDSSFPA